MKDSGYNVPTIGDGTEDDSGNESGDQPAQVAQPARKSRKSRKSRKTRKTQKDDSSSDSEPDRSIIKANQRDQYRSDMSTQMLDKLSKSIVLCRLYPHFYAPHRGSHRKQDPGPLSVGCLAGTCHYASRLYHWLAGLC